MGAVAKLQEKCTDKVLGITNLVCAGIIAVVVVIRLFNFFSRKEFDFWVLTIYLGLFDAFLVAALLNKPP